MPNRYKLTIFNCSSATLSANCKSRANVSIITHWENYRVLKQHAQDNLSKSDGHNPSYFYKYFWLLWVVPETDLVRFATVGQVSKLPLPRLKLNPVHPYCKVTKSSRYLPQFLLQTLRTNRRSSETSFRVGEFTNSLLTAFLQILQT